MTMIITETIEVNIDPDVIDSDFISISMICPVRCLLTKRHACLSSQAVLSAPFPYGYA